MMKNLLRCLLAAAAVPAGTCLLAAAPQAVDDPESASAPIAMWRPGETKEQRDARMAWWRDAKFGMFIHWGLYAIKGGNLNGKNYNSEWMYAHAKIPVAEYKLNADAFHPDKFDAAAWVRLAKEAGQKYIIITTKHHDGFAMYPTKASKFNLRDASGFQRDPLAELATACRKEGIKLGFYYSQGQDWTNPGGGFVTSAKGPWDEAQKGDFDTYLDTVAIPQIRELLSNYGPDVPAILWFDTPTGKMTEARVNKLIPLLSQKPGLIINNRLRYRGPGDYSTPEAYIPPRGFVDRDWEAACMMNDHWGYSALDHKWKSTSVLLRQMVDAVSKGGNYLLNVGPTQEGVIPEESVKRLKEVGAWMKVNGEAIYGAQPTRFGAEAGELVPPKDGKGKPKFASKWDWRCTTKPGRIYLHLLKWEPGDFTIPPVSEKITKASLLADPKRAPLPIRQSDAGVTITLPATPPDPLIPVVCLEIAP